jgi:hypothetical protein
LSILTFKNSTRKIRSLHNYEALGVPACLPKHVAWLPEASKDSDGNYYRCADCGHVWSLRKDNRDAEPRHDSHNWSR